ncbi:MAG: FtsX-like permease family protein [Phycisphaeraceae bacterium]
MRIRTLAIANLKRRKGKAAFLAAGIALGIGTVVALLGLSGSIRREIGTQLDQFGANIVVVPKSDSLALNYGGVSVSSVALDVQDLTGADARDIRDIPYGNRLSVVAPKLLGSVEIEGRRVLLAGVDFASELQLKRWWRITGDAPQAEHEVLVGYEVAVALGLVQDAAPAAAHQGHGAHASPPGAAHDAGLELRRDRLDIAGAQYRVSGVIAPTAGPEDRMIFASLPHVQALLGKPDQLSLIEISALCKDCPVGDIVAQISTRVPHAKASAVQQTVRAREQAVDRLARFSAAVSGVVLAIGALLIFTTMTGAVMERTREIGVLRALGFRKRHIVVGLMIEVGLISLLGGLVGWGAGTLTSWAALPWFAQTDSAMEFHPWLMPAALGAALLIGVASSLYPIFRAARLDPTQALRAI